MQLSPTQVRAWYCPQGYPRWESNPQNTDFESITYADSVTWVLLLTSAYVLRSSYGRLRSIAILWATTIYLQ